MRKTLPFIAIILLMFISADAYAEMTGDGMLDDVIHQYKDAVNNWGAFIKNAATRLFWSLATISMVWTFGTMLLRKADIGEFFSEFIRFICFTGLFWWLLDNGPAIATAFFDGLRQLAGQTGGTSGLTPSSIVNVGFEIVEKTIKAVSGWSPIKSAFAVVISIVVLVVLALIGVNMLLLIITSWIVAYAGIFCLGFGGSRWTSDIAINYYKLVLSIALQLMAMILIVAIGESTVQTTVAKMKEFNYIELSIMLVSAIILLVLVNKVPPLIGGLVTGASAGNIGSYGAGSAMAAAGMAMAALATGGAAAASGAANAGGTMKALAAAFGGASATGSDSSSGGGGGDKNSSSSSGSGESAFAQAAGFGGSSSGGGGSSSGGGGSSSGGGGGSSDGDSGSSSGGGGSSTGSDSGSSSNSGSGDASSNSAGSGSSGSGSSSSGGFLSGIASGIGNLAKGTGQVLWEKANKRMDDSFAGQIAQKIKANKTPASPQKVEAEANKTQTDTASFNGNSLSGDDGGLMDEVRSFTNGLVSTNDSDSTT